MTTDTIKFKRGVKSKLNNLSYGEPAYISDEGELYIGTENGVEKLTNNKKVKELSSQLEHNTNKLVNYRYLNVKDFGAVGDGETDDTQAFKDAMQVLNNSTIDDVNGGWDSHTYILYIPSGVYIISEPNVLTPTHVNSMGFTIKGNGMANSIIKYTSTDTDNYLCQAGYRNSIGTNAGYINFSDFSVWGNGSNNFFAMVSQNGAPQDVYFSSVEMKRLHHNIVIKYGSANANADKFKFFGCNFSIPSGGILFGILDKGISQSVAHNFYGCNVYSEGTCIYLRSAGNLTYDGGSCVIKNGRFLDIEGLGADIPMNVGKLVVQNVKFEFFDNNVDDTLIYNNSSLPVVFSKCGFGQMVATKPTNRMINLQGSADVCFEHCVIPEPIKTLITNPGSSALKAFLKFDNCILSPLQSYNIENILTSASYNVHYLGKVVAENCSFGKDDSKENRLVNFHSDILRGFNIIPPTLKSHFIRNTGWGNVEYFGGTNTLYLPKSSTLKNIKFYLVNKTSSTTLTVKKGTKTIFTTVVDLSTIKDTNRLVETGDLLIEFSSDNIEENKLTIESSLGEIKGFVEIQYY